MVSRKEWYERVNAAWPKEVPPLTPGEATRAAKRLWRFGLGETLPFPILLTSGNRHTWMRGGTLRVNPNGGWNLFVHDMSHLMYWRANRYDEHKPHDKDHARFELKLRKEVLRRGWLDGKLKRDPKPKPQIDVRQVRYERTLASIERWNKKMIRAEKALKKLVARQRYYEKQLNTQP